MTDIHTQVSTITNAQAPAVANLLNELSNFFYAATQPIEAHEYDEKVTADKVMTKIRANFTAQALKDNQNLLIREFQNAGWTEQQKKAAFDAALAVIDAQVKDRFAGGSFRGHGHHARQKIGAEAFVAMAKALKLTA